jgi:hypothetical protein
MVILFDVVIIIKVVTGEKRCPSLFLRKEYTNGS